MYKLQIGLTHDIHCQNFYQFAFHIKKGGLEYDEHTSIADDDDFCFQHDGNYFLESGDKIRYFFEKDAFDSEGEFCTSQNSLLMLIINSFSDLVQDDGPRRCSQSFFRQPHI